MVFVAQPIACQPMKLHIARPQRVADAYFGIEHIGTGVGVALAGVDYLHTATVGSGLLRCK